MRTKPRPPRIQNTVQQIRLPVESKRAWEKAAEDAGMGLSQWMRSILDGAAPPEERPRDWSIVCAMCEHFPCQCQELELPKPIPQKFVLCARCKWLKTVKRREPIEGCKNCRWEDDTSAKSE